MCYDLITARRRKPPQINLTSSAATTVGELNVFSSPTSTIRKTQDSKINHLMFFSRWHLLRSLTGFFFFWFFKCHKINCLCKRAPMGYLPGNFKAAFKIWHTLQPSTGLALAVNTKNWIICGKGTLDLIFQRVPRCSPSARRECPAWLPAQRPVRTALQIN